MAEQNGTVDLAALVRSFSDVFFELGAFATSEDIDVNDVKDAVEGYIATRAGYHGDTSAYDNVINLSLQTYPDLDHIPRVR